ncbi:MAG: VWA domain-containing protein, partial [Gammaproteobacteria bacterium]
MNSLTRFILGSTLLLFCLWVHAAEESGSAQPREPIPAEREDASGLSAADVPAADETDRSPSVGEAPVEMETAGDLPAQESPIQEGESAGQTLGAAGESTEPTAAAPFARDVVLVLDNSGSMKKSDPGFLTGQAVTGFIQRLDDSARVSIIAFDQDVRTLLPMTDLTAESRGRILESIRAIDYGGLLTDSPAAVERAIYELKNNARADARKLIVFMTDGVVDTGDAAADLE